MLSDEEKKAIYEEVKTKMKQAEEDRRYGRYKKYGGKIKLYRYLSRLYGMNEICELFLDIQEAVDE